MTTPPLYDVIIVGTGPAGVSAAFPLQAAGLKVLLIDADTGDSGSPGSSDALQPPVGGFQDLRFADTAQSDWLLGRDLHAIRSVDATSPKLRVPGLAHVFEGFAGANRIVTDNFAALGSLASGGLSNAWGCGVARFNDDDLAGFPLKSADLDASYAAVCARIGVSGAGDDALKAFYGLDAWAAPADSLEINGAALHARLPGAAAALNAMGARLGRARVAVLTGDQGPGPVADTGDRQACNACGLCLWGCRRKSLYSARFDLDRLKRLGTVDYQPGVVVDAVVGSPAAGGGIWAVAGYNRTGGGTFRATARRVILAAGTIATTRLVLQALDLRGQPRPLLSCPAFAFLVLQPRHLGRPAAGGVGFVQTAFTLEGVTDQGLAYGGLFPTTNLPAAEFVRYIPTSRATAISLWKSLSPATLVGNCFLPGALSAHTATLDGSGSLIVRGGSHPEVADAHGRLRKSLAKMFRHLGAMVVPGSVIAAAPGSDIHYAGTLPMRDRPGRGETTAYGEVEGLPGLFAMDGAALSGLPAKPHTLTIMANANRMATLLAARLKG
jgi:choline dehydrogenase-like flavoprotein